MSREMQAISRCACEWDCNGIHF